jgi:heme-degrading monooxygenase HmoA
MIARIWRGWTTPAHAPKYEKLLREEIFPGIARLNIPGYHGISLLKRARDDEVEFITIMWFEGLDAVRAFAGEDYEVAVVPPKARKLLSRFDACSTHFEAIVHK